MYRFTASYGEGYPTVNKTVYLTVQYLQACSESVSELTTGDCFSVQSDGNPVPILTCPLPHKKIVEKYSICAKDIASVSTCTIGNKVGSCKFTVIVYQQVNEFKQQSYLNCSNCIFDKDMADKNSDAFKKSKAKWETILRKVYLNKQYVTNITVLEFWPGSVIVGFELKLIANVSDPLSPLKKELSRNNGIVGGNSIDPSSIQPGIYVPPTLKPNSTNPPEVITKPSTRDKGVITGIAVFFTLLFIVVVILLVYCCYCKKRGLDKNRKYSSVKDNVTGNQRIIHEIGYDQL